MTSSNGHVKKINFNIRLFIFIGVEFLFLKKKKKKKPTTRVSDNFPFKTKKKTHFLNSFFTSLNVTI